MPEGEAPATTFVADGQHAPGQTLRVLLVNWSLQTRGGTESVIRDITAGTDLRQPRLPHSHCPN